MNALAEAPVDTDSTVHVQAKHAAGVPRPWAVRGNASPVGLSDKAELSLDDYPCGSAELVIYNRAAVTAADAERPI